MRAAAASTISSGDTSAVRSLLTASAAESCQSSLMPCSSNLPFGEARMPHGKKADACRIGAKACASKRSDELGVERYLGVENLGDGTVLLGFPRQLGELLLLEIGHFRPQ